MAARDDDLRWTLWLAKYLRDGFEALVLRISAYCPEFEYWTADQELKQYFDYVPQYETPVEEAAELSNAFLHQFLYLRTQLTIAPIFFLS